GILEWNKAYRKLGFAGAIKVDQQPDDPDFDPENIHYNTFRWMTADAGFAMGPSRVDPRTGQILDADIIFDASFLDSWNQRWETFRSDDVAALTPNWSPYDETLLNGGSLPLGHRHSTACSYCFEMQRQTGFAAAVFMASGVSATGELPKEFVHEGLKEVVMHEVGHTLGLRHNFKASTWKPLEEINNPESGKAEGTIASVMDYAPANLMVDPKEQGLYYSQTIGPYDYWAIEYGYKPISSKEDEELEKIASRAGEPQLAYGTDEDTRSFDPDPYSNRFDLGQDPLAYVKRQIETTSKLLPEVVDKTVKDGEGYQKARQAFNLLFNEYHRALGFAARFPGGVSVSRHHKGDENAKPPFEVIDAETQRDAMKLVTETAFSPPPIDGESLNYLAVSRWSHWGTRDPIRLDVPVHDDVLSLQESLLSQTLSSMTLDRILDNEFKVPDDKDAYTLAEHLDMIVNSIFSEWQAPVEGNVSNRKPAIDSFRRNLQRAAVRRLCAIVTHGSGSPYDAQTLVRMHLRKLQEQAEKKLDGGTPLDAYSRAHLADSLARIEQALNADVSLPIVN
ncbi:MAG: zinc-dependent metalloprotease, partial [Planctomycetaceae bacterium]|nr:zinc-dependent metalloprotease [Planctomycetaceae bacterium]